MREYTIQEQHVNIHKEFWAQMGNLSDLGENPNIRITDLQNAANDLVWCLQGYKEWLQENPHEQILPTNVLIPEED